MTYRKKKAKKRLPTTSPAAPATTKKAPRWGNYDASGHLRCSPSEKKEIVSLTKNMGSKELKQWCIKYSLKLETVKKWQKGKGLTSGGAKGRKTYTPEMRSLILEESALLTGPELVKWCNDNEVVPSTVYNWRNRYVEEWKGYVVAQKMALENRPDQETGAVEPAKDIPASPPTTFPGEKPTYTELRARVAELTTELNLSGVRYNRVKESLDNSERALRVEERRSESYLEQLEHLGKAGGEAGSEAELAGLRMNLGLLTESYDRLSEKHAELKAKHALEDRARKEAGLVPQQEVDRWKAEYEALYSSKADVMEENAQLLEDKKQDAETIRDLLDSEQKLKAECHATEEFRHKYQTMQSDLRRAQDTAEEWKSMAKKLMDMHE